VKVTAIAGSPRERGSSSLLLGAAVDAAREEGHEVTLLAPARMRIAPCRGCGSCRAEGSCVIDDDFGEVRRSLASCDRIVVATPVFFLGMPAQLKALVDRCQPFWSEKYRHGRPLQAGAAGRRALLLIVGGMRLEQGYGCVEASTIAFLRSISVDRHETLRFAKVDDPEDLRTRFPGALDDVRAAARRLLSS
jgi:multimeric flavodoxin WrbA